MLIAKGLREQAFAVDVTGDGEQASRLAFETSYDAIVLDVMLPGRDGLSVCRQIRARGALTPVLLLTAMDAVESRIQGLDSGADDYLTKPFAWRVAGKAPCDHPPRHAPIVPEVLAVGNLTIDTRPQGDPRRS